MRQPERRRRPRPLAPILLALVLLAGAGAAAAQAGSNAGRFDAAWDLVATRYWHLERTGVDWDQVRADYRPRAVEAPDDAALYALLEEMYSLLGDDHSVFVPPDRVAEVRAEYGDLPCVMFLGAAGGGRATAAAALPLLARAQGAVVPLTDEARLANVRYGVAAAGVGYVRLPDLASDGAAAAVRTAVTALESAGVGALVLDLRGNPGGRLVTMMQVAGVFTSGFIWRTITSWTLPLPYPAIGLTHTDLPLVVLIDGGVNSAAEGLAGGLQQRGRAVVVGERSAGNVEALLPFCLRDGSQAWIATGVLAPIGGPTWEGRGVEPDVAATSDTALAAALAYLASLKGE